MIEKNHPMPTTYAGLGGRRSSYPFMEMEVGDSVHYPGTRKTTDHPAYGVAKKYAIRSGNRKFSAKPEGDGIRIWRIA